MNHKIAHFILAAGSSSRMGISKQLLPWRHTSLLGWEIEKSLQLESLDTYVILGANMANIRKEISQYPVVILYNDNWQSGMGSSIGYGMSYLIENNLVYDSVLITLVDQPLIDQEHLLSLITLSNQFPKNIVATDLGSRYGVPALFPASFFEELVVLNQDYGARHIIKKYAHQLVVVDGKGKTDDIDTLKAYKILKNRE